MVRKRRSSGVAKQGRGGQNVHPLALLIVQFVKLLLRKMHFHHKHCEYDAHYAVLPEHRESMHFGNSEVREDKSHVGNNIDSSAKESRGILSGMNKDEGADVHDHGGRDDGAAAGGSDDNNVEDNYEKKKRAEDALPPTERNIVIATQLLTLLSDVIAAQRMVFTIGELSKAQRRVRAVKVAQKMSSTAAIGAEQQRSFKMMAENVADSFESDEVKCAYVLLLPLVQEAFSIYVGLTNVLQSLYKRERVELRKRGGRISMFGVFLFCAVQCLLSIQRRKAVVGTYVHIALLRKQYEDLYMSLRIFFARASRRREVNDFHKLPTLGPESALTQVLSASIEMSQIENADGSVVLAAEDFEIFIKSPQK